MNTKYIKRKMVCFYRELVGGLARRSPIKTSRFGYPDKIIEKAHWLSPAGVHDLPSYVKSVQILPERETRCVALPKRIKATDPLLWQAHYRWKPNQRHVVTLEKASVCRSLSIVTSDHTVLWELSHLWNVDPARHPLIRYPVLPAPRRLAGRTLFLSADMSDNYFHWMLDLLPKLTVIEEAGIDLSGFDHYIVCSLDKEFQRETLRRWGIPLEKVLESSNAGNRIEADVLVIPSWADQSSYYAESDMTRMKEVLLPAPSVQDGRFPKRFFISRRKDRARKIANERDFSKVLNEHGLASVELESLTFGEQARLFDQAEVVVGMHGAGLTNLLFCRPGTKVLELVNPNWPLWMYWNLAASRRLDYHYLLGKPVGFKRELFQEPEAEQRLQDLEIDTGAVDRALGSWFDSLE
jgi:capsular polysaccharide biosynthesis protein